MTEEKMEEWEILKREKLNNELEDGMYEIGAGNFIAHTGKGGKIEFEIALEKEFRKLYKL